MPFFRIRLILALVLGITLISIALTYFDVLAHKHVLRRELSRRSAWLGASLQPEIEQAVATGRVDAIDAVLKRLHRPDVDLGLAVYAPGGRLLASVGPADVIKALPADLMEKSIRKSGEVAAFGHNGDWQWLEDAFPLQESGQLNGVLVILEDARFIRVEGNAVWKMSFWRIAAFVVLIVVVTLLTLRRFLMRPMTRFAERLRL